MVLNFGITKKQRATGAYQRKIRSSTKPDLFYGIGIFLMTIATVGSLWIVGKNPDAKTDTAFAGEADSIGLPSGSQDMATPTSAKSRLPAPTKIASERQDAGMQKSLPTTPPSALPRVDVPSGD